MRGKLLTAGDFACDPTVQPRWLAEVAARRQSFANTAFVVDRGSQGVSRWKFVYAVQAPVFVGLCRIVEIPHYYEQRGVTTSTWGLLYEHAFRRIFKVNFADMALASDLGDVEPCRIEVLQRIQYVGGTRLVRREPAVDFLHFLGTVPANGPVTRGPTGGPSSAKEMRAGEDLLVLFPWLRDAVDKKHGFEAPSAHGGEAEHTGAEFQ